MKVRIFIILLVVLALGMLTNCNASPNPGDGDNGKLPFGVFPLNDVKWVYVVKARAGDWQVTTFIDTITYSVRQIGENEAEVYKSGKGVYGKLDENRIFIPTSEVEIYGPKLWAWIYLEDKKVYYLYAGPDDKPFGDKKILYDFNLQLNDTLEQHYISSIDSVLVSNEYRKCYNFVRYGYGTEDKYSVIEGIGSNIDFFEKAGYPDFMGYYYPDIINVYHKDKVIWTNIELRYKDLWEKK